jgi:hypothetical protein
LDGKGCGAGIGQRHGWIAAQREGATSAAFDLLLIESRHFARRIMTDA